MGYVIGKTFTFAASHQLSGLPENHQCGRLHGHNYTVWLELASDSVDKSGMVLDFGDLSSVRTYIDDVLDHRHLNDVFDMNPTAENIAGHLFGAARSLIGEQVTAVTVWETATCWARFQP